MVNVIIYLDQRSNAEVLVKHLLQSKLIASAVIDVDNISHTMKEGSFTREVFNVITSKSKSPLINQIVNAVEARLGEEVLITPLQLLALTAVLIKWSNKIQFQYKKTFSSFHQLTLK